MKVHSTGWPTIDNHMKNLKDTLYVAISINRRERQSSSG